ncbi:MAG: LacI family DNA-binding transcriptional regulator [Verrucomicrobiota bacterium]
MKTPTIQDIAKEAGVSKSTVSRVLNKTAAVHPEKQRSILLAINRLGFRPNVVARSLAKGRSMTIGILTQQIGSPYYDAVSQGVISGFDGTGYSPLFADGQWQSAVEMEAIRTLIGRRVDGLVLVGGSIPGEETLALCHPLPTVVVGRKLSHLHCIYTDNVDGGYQATRHLLDSGHREIAIILGIEHHPDAVDRFAGYRQALKEAGIGLNQELVADGDFTAESGVAGIEKLLASGQSFSAVFASNDATAFGARLALYRKGVDVPKEVSLVGFDDQAEAAFMAPPLTTIHQPAREMGRRASEALMKLIHGETFQTRSLKGQLRIRESVSRIQG